MSPTTRHVKKHARARQRRRCNARERLEHGRRQAQQAIKDLQKGRCDVTRYPRCREVGISAGLFCSGISALE
jgi:hypothetical protein